jgi:2',3'-cyclic-nucleotide 2'-phosphodiesterase
MRLAFLGDIVGRSGREAVLRHLPALRQALRADFIIANAENAAGGFGITGKMAQELQAAGIDVITLGNHAWDQRELLAQIDAIPNLVRPANFPDGTPGRGHCLTVSRSGRYRLLTVNVMGRVFMDPMDDPFAAVEKVLRLHPLGGARMGPQGADAILVDMHAEASSEKMIMAHVLDGRVSAVIGTHSHVPTADARILSGGTAYQTDAGMCGDYDSIIGMKKEAATHRMLRKTPGERLSPAENDATASVCGTFIETDDKTGLAVRITPLRIGGPLAPAWPAG